MPRKPTVQWKDTCHCGKPKLITSKQCKSCANAAQQAASRTHPVLQLHQEGKSLRQIAQLLGVSKQRVGQIVQRNAKK